MNIGHKFYPGSGPLEVGNSPIPTYMGLSQAPLDKPPISIRVEVAGVAQVVAL
jgi:hypothetical protein